MNILCTDNSDSDNKFPGKEYSLDALQQLVSYNGTLSDSTISTLESGVPQAQLHVSSYNKYLGIFMNQNSQGKASEIANSPPLIAFGLNVVYP